MRTAKGTAQMTRLLPQRGEVAVTERQDKKPTGTMLMGTNSVSGECDVDHRPMLLTVNEAASMLRIGRTVAYQLMQKGEIRSVKIGRVRRIVAISMREYIKRLEDEASED